MADASMPWPMWRFNTTWRLRIRAGFNRTLRLNAFHYTPPPRQADLCEQSSAPPNPSECTRIFEHEHDALACHIAFCQRQPFTRPNQFRSNCNPGEKAVELRQHHALRRRAVGHQELMSASKSTRSILSS
jgi:hypothetical protein